MASAIYYIKKYSAISFILLIHSIAVSQNRIIDSLTKAAAASPKDSVKSLLLLELAFNNIGYDTVKCDQALTQAYRIIVNKKEWYYNRGYYFEVKSQVTFWLGKYSLSLLQADTAIGFYSKSRQSGDILTRKNSAFRNAVIIADKGATYSMMGDNEEGIRLLLEALRLYEQSDHQDKYTRMATCYNNIATIYYGQKQYDKSMEYDVKAIPYHLRTGDNESVSWAYIYAASDFSMMKQFDSAKLYFLKAEPHVKELNKPSVNIEYYGKTGGLYWTQKIWKTAISYYTIAYDNAKKINDWYNQAAYLRGIADCYYFDNNQPAAEAYALRALEVNSENNFPREKRLLYNLLSLIYFKNNDFKNAYLYSQKYIAENIKINDEEHKKTIADLDKKYLTVQKEKEILQLQKDKQIQELSLRQKSTLNYILIGSVFTLIIVVFLGYRNIRHRQRLAKQKEELQQRQIIEMQKDKQLVAVDSLLKGQEEERSRLAKDLHDGLGGLLSGVKFSLSNMKYNLIITADNMAVFERSLDMIDTSIKELRRVAHNMMPEMLTKFGLDEALKEYCNTINATNMLMVKYQSIGMETRIEKSSEIIIYRIIQELLNNIMKHAAAKEAMVQLIRQDDRLNIIIEDDGKGFDPAELKNTLGVGLTSIQSRVDYLKGQLEIHSEVGKGSLINIEFKI